MFTYFPVSNFYDVEVGDYKDDHVTAELALKEDPWCSFILIAVVVDIGGREFQRTMDQI